LAGPASFDHLFDGKSYHRQEMEKVRRRSWAASIASSVI
jgi:hypothetical protein